MKTKFFIGMLSLANLQADFPFSYIPNYEKLSKPRFESIEFQKSENNFTFTFRGLRFTIAVDSAMKMKPVVSLERHSTVIASHEIGNEYLLLQDPDIRSFDADQNGIADLFVAYSHGPSGRNSAIEIVDAFFFFADSTYKFHELSSFYGSYDLFRDFNNDGKLEFGCFRFDRSASSDYSYLNLFSMTNGEFRNISHSVPGYPLFIEERETGKRRVLKQAPAFLKDSWKAQSPSVWNN